MITVYGVLQLAQVKCKTLGKKRRILQPQRTSTNAVLPVHFNQRNNSSPANYSIAATETELQTGQMSEKGMTSTGPESPHFDRGQRIVSTTVNCSSMIDLTAVIID